MSNPWFRMYTEAVDDEKLRLLAFEDRWHFIALLCCKGKGIIDEDNKDLMKRKVAIKLGIDLRTMEEVMRRLAEVELIDEKTLQPLGWVNRQFNSDFDSTAAERKRRQRERERQLQPVTDESRVTSHKVTRTEEEEEADTDTEADTESLKERVVGGKEEQRVAQARTHAPEPPLTRSSKPKNAPTKTVIPANWTPADATYALLEKQGIQRAFADECLDEFRLYWTERQEQRPGWESTFVNSVKRSWERHPATVTPLRANKHERVIAKNGTSIDAWLNRSTPSVIEGECCEIR